jgi:23S rRNA (cytidine2498-2'-O)-methyltransferase
MAKHETLAAPEFLLTTCQQGAEAALKREVGRMWPGFRLAYSRPGFVTFKLPPEQRVAADFDLQSVFARAYAFSLGKVTADDSAKLAAAAWRLAGDIPVEAVHAWQRDPFTPGYRGFEPGPTELGRQAHAALVSEKTFAGSEAPEFRATPRGVLVLDCVVVEPGQWWIGYHKTRTPMSQWPGGMRPAILPPHAVSRAYLKMEEALDWSRLPVLEGDHWAELGCAPGGAAQALLDRGLVVLGIDPAEVDPVVTAHPNFRHLRRRTKEVRRREFFDIRYIVADMNVAPNYTLDAVENIVTHAEVHIEGVILTLKLAQWSVADEIPKFVSRIRRWGFEDVQARQLAHNRQEICVAARRADRKRPGSRRKPERQPVDRSWPSTRSPSVTRSRKANSPD